MSNSDRNLAIRRRALVPRESCPMAIAADVLGDKWTLLILREAFYGVVRYDDMLQDLGAPRSTLTDRLNKLVKHKVLERRPYQLPGERQRYLYALTNRGKELSPLFIAMTKWGEDHLLEGKAPVQAVQQNTGEAVYISLTNEQGQPVDISQVTLSKCP